ncbi:winged helix DNA-binding protein [Nocardia amamiensis]|uniref:Winged helix DNA-binding protein n=1 Tax=Nocardia amamiensis TaxID=404578 RepID=A0ABS0CR06_9NOCA|nr:MarR family transcriptional regulator [Nocardia amamiensis]MBF6298580.1 winged helix DNA-binding protein [Nocardia amamiensis]
MPNARPDLAAMIVPLGRALMAAELPVLDRHELSMWGYAVLLGLDAEPVYTQAALAKAIGADKTRIIGVLDELQRRGLISREPDPADRRVNLVSLTEAGRALRDRAQRDIQDREDQLLERLPAADRRVFLRALRTLSDAVAEQSRDGNDAKPAL